MTRHVSLHSTSLPPDLCLWHYTTTDIYIAGLVVIVTPQPPPPYYLFPLSTCDRTTRPGLHFFELHPMIDFLVIEPHSH